MAMELRTAALGYIPMLVATGCMDQSGAADLRAALHKWLDSGHNIIFLDLSEIDCMDSSGVSVLLAGVGALERGWLGVIGASPEIQRLLEIEGLLADPRFRVFETRQAALAVTGERAST